MKSILRRILGCITAAMLMCALPVLAFATEGDGNGNGAKNPPAQTYSINLTGYSLEGYAISAYKVMSVTAEDIQSPNGKLHYYSYGNYAVTSDFESFAFDGKSKDDLVSYLFSESVNDATRARLATELSQHVKDNHTKAVNVNVTINETGATIGVSEQGYYLITITPSQTSKADICAPILVTIPAETGSDNIPVKIDTTPHVSKAIVKQTVDSEGNASTSDEKFAIAEVGSNVRFEIRTSVPVMGESYSQSGYALTIVDTWNDGLNPDLDSVNIKIGETTVYPSNTSEGDPLCTVTQREGKSSFEIVFDPSGFYSGYKDLAYTEIVITYDAEVTSGLIDQTNQTAGNEVRIYYPEKPETPDNPGDPDDKVEVKTITLQVWKCTLRPGYDKLEASNQGMGLNGAEFRLFKKEVGENGKEVIKYYQNNEGKISWVENREAATTRTSDKGGKDNKDGYLQFEGLSLDGSYWLEETKAPDTFNGLSEPQKVIMPASLEKDKYIYEEWVQNSKGIVLPGTGGVGTVIFYCVGGALVLGALVVLVARRRMASRDK